VLHLIVYGLLNLALIVMREADVPEYRPDFEVPLYPAVPVMGALTSFGLIAFREPVEIGLSLVFVAGGLVWYLAYARTRATKKGVLSQYVLNRSDELPAAAVSAANTVQPDGGEYRVMVPLADPQTEMDLITLASAVAAQRGGTVDAVHIVTAPDQTSLEHAADHLEEVEEDYHAILDDAKRDAETFGVNVETHTIVSHRLFGEIFDAARDHGADLVVMGWEDDTHGSPGRVEGALDDLTEDLPCDFLVMRDRGFDPDHILVPTAGGPDSDLSAEVATLLREEFDSRVTRLHVADEVDEGERFLAEWAERHGLEDATLRVETGDVEAAIGRAASDSTMVIIGATERGLLSRLFDDSLVLNVVDTIDCSVLLVERPRSRGVLDRLM
jgi:nucleotide-binding universal stress UspA family protein